MALAANQESPLPLPLAGLRVLDLTHYIAGPYCTKLLADYGADVIKVERPDGGDPARRLGPFLRGEPHLEGSGLFLHLNTNKRSITLNLKTEAAKNVLLALVRESDVLVESFAPRVLPSLGLGYDPFRAGNPRLVMTSISNFGQTGPYRDYKMSEITLYAMGGTMHSTGEEEREPVKLGLTVEQFYCGMVAASATMGASVAALRHGTGQHLDLSLFEFMVGSQDRAVTALTAYQYTGNALQRRGAETGGGLSPVYPVADGYVQFFSLQRVADRVFRMIDRPDLIEDRAAKDLSDPEQRAAFNQLLLEWIVQRTKQEVMEKAQSVGLFCGAVNSVADVFEDPHLRSRGFFAEIDHPYSGRLRYPGLPFILTRSPGRPGRAPLLGEHSRQVLSGRLGYGVEDITSLREQGAI